MIGVSGHIKLTIHRSSGIKDVYESGNTVEDAISAAILARIKNDSSSYAATAVPDKIKVTLSGDGGDSGNLAVSAEPKTFGNDLNSNAYTNSIVYNKTGITFSSASNDTIATVSLLNSSDTVLASKTAGSFTLMDTTDNWTATNPTFGTTDKLDVEYTLTFTHTDLGSIDGVNYNDNVKNYRDKIINNVAYGGSGYPIQITELHLLSGASVVSKVTTLSWADSGTNAITTGSVTWVSVRGNKPTLIEMRDASGGLAGVFGMGNLSNDSTAFSTVDWTSRDSVQGEFRYSVAVS